ncbi:MAG: S24 family peptidase [Actinobacteria bacterium]|nr:S24 family peptidase [Actinomycetota bacterium]
MSSRWRLVRVRGVSMQPSFDPGDLLLVSSRRPPRPADAAVVRLPPDRHGTPRPVALKRLVHAEPGGWWIDSDNARHGVTSFEVGLIPVEDVLGVVRRRLWPMTPRPGGAQSRGQG